MGKYSMAFPKAEYAHYLCQMVHALNKHWGPLSLNSRENRKTFKPETNGSEKGKKNLQKADEHGKVVIRTI